MPNQPPGSVRHELAVGFVVAFWVLALLVLSVAVVVLALVALTGTLH